MKAKWEYQYLSAAQGKVYHKNNDIMGIYSHGHFIRLWKNIQNDKSLGQNFYPCFAEKCLEMKRK